MFSWITKTALVATAIAPVLLVYAIVFVRDQKYVEAAIFLLVTYLLVWASRSIISYARRTGERLKLEITSIEAADRENIAFLLLYLLPLINGDASSPDYFVSALVLLVFGVVVATGHSYHFNPLLGIFGWHFYRVSISEGVTYVVLTKRTLLTKKAALTITPMTEYMMLDTED